MCDLSLYCALNSQPAEKILKIVQNALVTKETLAAVCVTRVFL